jgi:peptidoglycan/xylan/chitin deacetylase (PgdA/CDA1 family)
VAVPHGLHAFFYHVVSDRPLAHVRHLYAYKSPAQFAQDLALLARRFRLVAHEDIVRHVRGEGRLPPGAAAISFDDGFGECFDVVRPLLLAHGVPCTFFVVRDLLDNRLLMHKNAVSLCLEALAGWPDAGIPDLASRLAVALDVRLRGRAEIVRLLRRFTVHDRERVAVAAGALGVDLEAALRERPYLTLDQVRQLARDGFTIGGHTCRHAELDSFPEFADAEGEIVDSCRFVRDLTGRAEVPFAITFNGLRIPRTALASLLGRHPFISLVYDTNDLLADHPLVVNRIWADTPAGATAEASNLPFLLKRAKALEPIRRWKRRWQGLPR